MLYAIWYHLYNLKNEKSTHGGVLLQPATLLRVTFLHEWRFLNYTNDTKSRNVSHFLPLNPLKTLEIKFVLTASLAIKLNKFISEFYSLGCSFNIKKISILPVSWWVRSVTKNEEGKSPFYSLPQISPTNLNKGPMMRSTFPFQTWLWLSWNLTKLETAEAELGPLQDLRWGSFQK